MGKEGISAYPWWWKIGFPSGLDDPPRRHPMTRYKSLVYGLIAVFIGYAFHGSAIVTATSATLPQAGMHKGDQESLLFAETGPIAIIQTYHPVVR